MTSFVATVTAAWTEVCSPLLEQGYRSSLRVAPEHGKAVVEVEGPAVAAIIEVWEHGLCLDTTVVELSSGESLTMAAGPCQSLSEAVGRLGALRAELLQRGSDSAV